MIRVAVNDFENNQYSRLLQQIEGWNTPAPGPFVTPDDGDDDGDSALEPPKPPMPDKPKVEIVGARDVSVAFNKPLLETEADIESYLASYKQALISTVSQGKKVRV